MSDEPTACWWRTTLLELYCWKRIYSAIWWSILVLQRVATIIRVFLPLWEISHPWTEAETVEGEVADRRPQLPSVGLCASGRMVRASSCCGGTVWSRRCTLSSRTASCALCALEASPVSADLTQWRTPQADLSDRDQAVVAAVQPQKSCLWSHDVETLEVRRSRSPLCCEGAPRVDLSGYFPVLPLYFHSPHPQLF